MDIRHRRHPLPCRPRLRPVDHLAFFAACVDNFVVVTIRA